MTDDTNLRSAAKNEEEMFSEDDNELDKLLLSDSDLVSSIEETCDNLQSNFIMIK